MEMTEKKSRVKNIFDNIAPKYDFLNHLLSFGIDKRWRKKALKLSGINSDSVLLDVACGTGDVAIEAHQQGVKNIFGADLSHNMLLLFDKKADWIKGRNIQMVAEYIPLKDESVTNITVAFGVRNFYDIKKGFRSFHRILKREGNATIIEFRMPSNKIFKTLYKFYFKKVLPFIGGLISGDRGAYEYLPASVEEFDEKIDLKKLLNKAGFNKIDYHSFTFGTVQVLVATK